MKISLQKVYEKVDYGEGYSHMRVGLRVDDRIIWFGYFDSHRHNDEYKKMESLVDDIVIRLSEDVR